jgi:branched-chain amino acid transport system ATP-binding protein
MTPGRPAAPGKADAMSATSAAPALLEIEDLTVRFGGLTAVEALSFRVEEKQIAALIGPNGAGKTTAFNAISRLVKPAAGRIRMCGVDLLQRRPSQVSELGLTRTFQNLALWPGLTVLENVMVGAHHRGRQGFASATLRLGTAREERGLRDESLRLLSQFGIADVAFQPCEGLPYGTLKRVELARALAGRPKLLMLDEPAAGLTHGEVRELGDLIRLVRQTTDVSVLLIEHHMRLVMSVSDWVIALASGKKLVEGPPAEVQQDERLIDAYLGGADSHAAQ